jgi:hypothetical protein
MAAAENGHLGTVQALLDCGALVNAVDNYVSVDTAFVFA